MNPERLLLKDLASAIKPPKLRTMRVFAESEIIIPDGPFEGRKFSCSRQPCSALFLEATQDPFWSRFNSTGPTQSGKTLLCFVIPTMFHLFEIGETVICGLPSMDMAADKWNEDLLPAIERSRYREFLPRRGPGSKGGKSNLRSIQFANGATLRFMSGGGGDKKRAGFTARVLVITETDGLDETGGSSREADKVTQLEARTGAYGDRARTYMECTVSVESGRTQREYKAGSESRIAIRCPHCSSYVTPEREHLTGWQDAVDIIAAGEKAAIACPECGAAWTEDDRRTANLDCKLVHRGQTVNAEGVIVGDRPRTNTLGFRWTAANNLLKKTSLIGQAEWKASRSGNEENAEKEMLQFWWAKPYKPATLDLTIIDHNAIMAKVDRDHPRGHVPADTQFLTLGIDIGKRLARWVLAAFRANATPHVADYGVLEVQSDVMAEERAIVLALQTFRDEVIAKGWESPAGRRMVNLGFIDARYKPEATFKFCDDARAILFPSMGYGTTQRNEKSFIRRGRDQCVMIGEEYQVVRRGTGVTVEINTDHWKSWLHNRLQTPAGQPGAFTLFRPEPHDPNCHLSFAKHLTAEKKVEEYITNKGLVTRWVMLSRNNHYLDAMVYASVAAYAAGARLMGQESLPLPTSETKPVAAVEIPARDEKSFTTAYRGRW